MLLSPYRSRTILIYWLQSTLSSTGRNTLIASISVPEWAVNRSIKAAALAEAQTRIRRRNVALAVGLQMIAVC